MMELLSRHLFQDLWDLKDHSIRMRCYRDLQRSQWLPRQEQEQTQLRALRAIVAYAKQNVPWYRETLQDSPATIMSAQDLPILDKEQIQAHGDQLISEEFDSAALIEARTGGSTGKPLRVLFDVQTQQRRNAAQERSNEWVGARRGVAQIALWGNPIVDRSLKGRLRRHLLDRVSFVDTVGFNAESAQKFAEQWLHDKARVIFGHAHSIYLLARYLQQDSSHRIRPDAIISTSMSLLNSERQMIETVFDCPVTDRYGCEEVGLIAAQCEQHDKFHINSEHVLVEIAAADGSPCAADTPGQILVTDLVNRGMPLIRYRVGDTATWSDAICECGRESQLLANLGGRLADFLRTSDGSHVAGISLIERTLTAFAGLSQMQVIQQEIDQFDINFVKAGNFEPDSLAAIRREFETIFGPGINVEFHEKTNIPQQESGKYRFAICNVKDDL